MSTGLKANLDGSAAIQVSGSDAIQLTTGLAATFVNNVSVTGDLTLTGNPSGIVKAGTAVASTSGTSIDFTGIPSTVKRITVMFSGVSTTGTTSSTFLIQIGDSGGVSNTGYSGYCHNAAGPAGGAYTTGFGVTTFTSPQASTFSGQMVISSLSSSNTWSFGVFASATGAVPVTAGTKALTNTLDRVRITTPNGTDTFDAGSINILYE